VARSQRAEIDVSLASPSAACGAAGSQELDVRVEAFNITNTPPLGVPNGVFGSAAFGTITSAGDPRVIQLALKFQF
jgi:hypothetical protein